MAYIFLALCTSFLFLAGKLFSPRIVKIIVRNNAPRVFSVGIENVAQEDDFREERKSHWFEYFNRMAEDEISKELDVHGITDPVEREDRLDSLVGAMLRKEDQDAAKRVYNPDKLVGVSSQGKSFDDMSLEAQASFITLWEKQARPLLSLGPRPKNIRLVDPMQRASISVPLMGSLDKKMMRIHSVTPPLTTTIDSTVKQPLILILLSDKEGTTAAFNVADALAELLSLQVWMTRNAAYDDDSIRSILQHCNGSYDDIAVVGLGIGGTAALNASLQYGALREEQPLRSQLPVIRIAVAVSPLGSNIEAIGTKIKIPCCSLFTKQQQAEATLLAKLLHKSTKCADYLVQSFTNCTPSFLSDGLTDDNVEAHTHAYRKAEKALLVLTSFIDFWLPCRTYSDKDVAADLHRRFINGEDQLQLQIKEDIDLFAKVELNSDELSDLKNILRDDYPKGSQIMDEEKTTPEEKKDPVEIKSLQRFRYSRVSPQNQIAQTMEYPDFNNYEDFTTVMSQPLVDSEVRHRLREPIKNSKNGTFFST